MKPRWRAGALGSAVRMGAAPYRCRRPAASGAGLAAYRRPRVSTTMLKKGVPVKRNSQIAAWALALSTGFALPALAAATLVGNVHGYTLANDRLQQFSGLVFDSGKVLTTGDDAALRKKYPDAKYVDGG